MASPAPEAPHVVGTVPGLEEAIQKRIDEAVRSRLEAAQPAWERHLKRAVAVVAGSCAAVVPFLSPTEDALAFKACAIIAAIGVGLGITSSGNPPKK